MKRLLLITFLLLSSAPAYAERMTVSIIDQAGAIVYVDPDTIHRKGGPVTMWELIDYETIQNVTGASLLSARLQREYDCAGDLYRTLGLRKLSGNMETGKMILIIQSNESGNQPIQGASRNVYGNLRATRRDRAVFERLGRINEMRGRVEKGDDALTRKRHPIGRACSL